MKNFSVSIDNLDAILYFRNFKNLSISAIGELDCGSEFRIQTVFSLDGEINSFSLANLDGYTLDFYNEIGEATKKIKDIHSNLNSIIKEIHSKKSDYDNEISEIKKELSHIEKEIDTLEKEINEITQLYKKARGQNRKNIEANLNDKKKELSNKEEKSFSLQDKIEEIIYKYISKINNDFNANI